MLRTVVLALSFAFVLSPSWAQTVTAAPDTSPAGPLLRNAPPPLEDTTSAAFQARQSWRRTMAQKPTPKPGCFSTKFPSTEWTEIPCSNAPALPHPPRLGPAAPSTGGAANNSPIVSVPPSHPITSISGFLAQVSGVTSESDPSGAGRWSLQLNANTFSSPNCGGQAGCSGWQQFIADNPGNVYIQYWLIGHTSPCPATPAGLSGTWTYFPGVPAKHQASGCFINGNQTPAPQQGLDGLQGLRLTGSSSSISQSATYEIANGFLVTATDAGDPLSIGANWTRAEFNIFGYSGGTTSRSIGLAGRVDCRADRGLRW